MTDILTDGELDQKLFEACDLAANHADLTSQIEAHCLALYGITPSLLGASGIINAIQCGLEPINSEELDAMMSEAIATAKPWFLDNNTTPQLEKVREGMPIVTRPIIINLEP